MADIFLRIYFGPEAWLGPGRVALLEAIDRHGSISAGARVLGMSYRRAWLLVAAMNRLFDAPIVTTSLGGRQGGTATLTPLGTAAVVRYRAMERDAAAVVAPHVAALRTAARKARRRPRR